MERAEGWRLCLQPDGNQFDLESLVNAPLVGQANEFGGFDPRAVAAMASTWWWGAAMGARVLNPEFTYGWFPRPSHYVQRDNSNCAADFENGLPAIGTFIPLGTPRVAADPTQGAFFIANVGFHAGDGVKGVNIVKSIRTWRRGTIAEKYRAVQHF